MNSVPSHILRKLVTDVFDVPCMQNNFRSLYVEYLIADALGDDWKLVGAGWAGWDIESQSGFRLEVKQSAAMQSWASPSGRPSNPRFDIKKRKGYWQKGNKWIAEETRFADIYVFAWHPHTSDSCDQRDPTQWQFYVVLARALPDQASIGLSSLSALTRACSIEELNESVQAAIKEITR